MTSICRGGEGGASQTRAPSAVPSQSTYGYDVSVCVVYVWCMCVVYGVSMCVGRWVDGWVLMTFVCRSSFGQWRGRVSLQHCQGRRGGASQRGPVSPSSRPQPAHPFSRRRSVEPSEWGVQKPRGEKKGRHWTKGEGGSTVWRVTPRNGAN